MKQNKKLIGIIISLVLVFGCIIGLTLQQSSQKQSPVKSQTEQKSDNSETKPSDQQKESSQETTKQKETNHKTTSTQKEQTESSSKQAESKQTDKKQEDSQSSTKQESQSNQTPKQEVDYITISIDCQTLLNHMDQVPEQYKSYIPSNGIILNSKKVRLNDGDSVFDMIVKTTKMNKIQLTQNSGYIQSIHNIPEKMLQGSGGWMYSVNGTYASIGCKEYKLKNGDHVTWRYTSYTGDLNS